MIGLNQSVVQVRERKIVTGRKFQEGIHTFLRSTYVTVHRTSRQYPTVMLYKHTSVLNLITQLQLPNDKPHEKSDEERNTDLSNDHNTVTGYCGVNTRKLSLCRKPIRLEGSQYSVDLVHTSSSQ